MSIKVMTMVFDRYPEGGNERLLALAMADHARDDGSQIWPSVAELARKTLQSDRTVQRQIAKMVERGWLIQVRATNGRPGMTNQYRICEQWIAGGEIPARAGQTGDSLSPVCNEHPVDKVSGSVDKVIHTGDTSDETGDTAMSPESSGTVLIPPLPPVATGGCDQTQKPGPEQPGSEPQTAEQPNTGLPGRLKPPPWRWRETRSGIEQEGERLGLGRWDERAHQVGGGEAFSVYEKRVIDAHWVWWHGLTKKERDMVQPGRKVPR